MPLESLLRQAAGFVYVDDPENPSVDEEDSHHLIGVLRLRTGEDVIAADGKGRFCSCRLSGRSKRREGASRSDSALCELEVMSALIERPAPSPRIVIALSLVKGERTEWAVAKLAEVGADEIVPLLCDRTVVRPDPKSALRRHLRMCRVARAASMQARRLFQPRVAAITTLSDAVRHLSATDGHTSVCMADPGGETISPRWPVVFIGPEGGWSEAELSYQLPLVSLGDTMLRVETAAVVAATSLVSFRLQSAS